jgi:hypothetical protein
MDYCQQLIRSPAKSVIRLSAKVACSSREGRVNRIPDPQVTSRNILVLLVVTSQAYLAACVSARHAQKGRIDAMRVVAGSTFYIWPV